MGVSRSRHVRLDQLTASAPVFDGYCFNLNFGHFTGASLLSHNVPHPDMGCSLALQRVKGCGTPEVNIALGNWLAMQEACLLETKAAD